IISSHNAGRCTYHSYKRRQYTFFHRYHPDLFVNMIMPLNDIRLNNNNNCTPFKSSILNPISDKSLIYRFHEYLNIT
ncbi:hypothetical protein, partial [Pseudomonas aeruginosa]|uniref:hypothetical protein n=1 Tax=Pseudomonas aeruginosa TaxID=287 RepID=UPI001968DE49